MTFDLEDLRRAARAGGDISAFSPVYAGALDCPAALVASDLSGPVSLDEFAPEIETGNLPPPVGRNPASPGENRCANLKIIAFGEHQRGARDYLARMIRQLSPAVVMLDLAPPELGAWSVYSHSLFCALGLPLSGRIVSRDSARFELKRDFAPGDLCESAVLECRLRKIPLIGIGQAASLRAMTPVPSQGYVDLDEIESLIRPGSESPASTDYDSDLEGCESVSAGLELSLKAAQAELAGAGDGLRQRLIDQSRYAASRAFDLLRGLPLLQKGQNALALIRLDHLIEFEYIFALLCDGLMSETYLPVKSDLNSQGWVLTGTIPLGQQTTEVYAEPEVGKGQSLFLPVFKDYVNNIEKQLLSPNEALNLVSGITRRTRSLPEIKRGASVRGSLAFQEISQSLGLIEGGLSARVVQKAALIALPPRIALAKTGSAREVIEDITKEEIFKISFRKQARNAALAEMRSLGSEMMKNLRALENHLSEAPNEPQEKGAPAVVDSQPDNELLRSLEKKNLLRRDETGQYSLTRQALQFLMDELEERFKSREIGEAEYQKQKARLGSQMRRLSEPQFTLSSSEIASTVMEMIDAQDRQWNSEINFNSLHVYYHIKDSVEGAFLSPQKRDYFALKRLIDDMERRRILAPAQDSGGFVLTGLALEILLKHLVRTGRHSHGSRLTGQSQILSSERKREVRRYSSCDPFRAISFRHTLREVARQRKSLSQLKRQDLRVFLKLKQKPKIDILLCLDISGSMGFQQKLIYARLAAAGVIEAALKEGHRVGIVAFNDHGQVSVPLGDSNRLALLNCLASLAAKGNTNIGDGIRASREMLAKAGGANHQYIVLISDGQPSAISQNAYDQLKQGPDKDLTQESAFFEAREAVARGAHLSVIHVAARHEPSDAFIKELARIGKGEVARLTRPQDLTSILAN